MRAMWFATVACLGLGALTALSADEKADRASEKDTPTPAACYGADSRVLHVFSRSKDGDILEMYRSEKDGEAWVSRNLTKDAKAPKAASSPSAYSAKGKEGWTQHVIYCGEDGQICELFLGTKQDKWNFNTLTTEAKAPKCEGDPIGFVSENPAVQHVFYRTSDGTICDLYRAPDAKAWAFNDLTLEAKAAKAASKLCAYLEGTGRPLGGAATQHIVYRGEDGGIHELFLAPSGGKWGHNNLTKEAGSTVKAVGSPCAYARQDNPIQHVFFTSGDGAVNDLYRNRDDKDAKWRANSLTKEANAPKAMGSPFCYLGNNIQHVVYRGEDGGVHELFLAPKGEKWSAHNLTKAASAPKATGNIVGFASPIGTTEHLFFQTGDGLYELFVKPDGETRGWKGRNLTMARP